jgi:phage terminase large subunit-like protein
MKTKPPRPASRTDPGDLRRRLSAALSTDWRSIAREEQIAPAGDWTTWIFCAGRGAGKTRSGAEWVQERVETGVARRIHLIAPTAADCRDVLLEGPAGVLSIAQPHMRPIYSSSLRKVEWPNGAVALLFSSDEPDRLRGPQCDTLWIDELCAMRSAQEVLDMAMLGLRLSKDPRCLITTTPRPIKPFKALVARAGQDVVITRCSTMANAENLARPFLSQILQQYQGTRLGRQELNAELLLDVPGALWTLQMLEDTRVKEAPAQLQRIVIGVDPAGSSAEWADQTGIVVAALGQDQHVYIIEDASGNYTPSQWAQVVVDLYHRHRADRICVERNYGGDMVEATIRTADPSVAIKTVTSSRGKVLRAEPIAALWEQKRAHVVGSLPALEDQLTNFSHAFDRARDGSPDKLDAAVFACTELTSGATAGGYFSVNSLLANGEPVDLPRRISCVVAVAATPSKSGEQIGVVYLGCDEHKVNPWPLVILDWDLHAVDDALFERWLPALFERLASLALACETESAGLWLHGSAGVSAALLQQSTDRGYRAHDIDSQVDWAAAPLADRAAAASRHLHTGRRVKIARPAYEKLVEICGHRRNHLLAEFSTFRLDEEMESDELLRALLSGVLISLDNSGAAAGDVQISPQPIAPPAQPVRPPVPTIFLTPGKHVIDGRAVDVPADGDKDLVEYPIDPGPHIVDEKRLNVARPGAGFQVSLQADPA